MTCRLAALFTIALLVTPLRRVPAQAPPPCPANPCGVTVSGTLGMSSVARMSLSGTSGGITTLTPPKAADFSAGFKDSNGPLLTVSANTAVRVRVSPNAVTTWLKNGVSSAKPASELQWSTTGGAPFTTVTTATDLLATGGATTGLSKNITYRVTYSFTTDVPGTWTLPLVFTLVSP